MEKQQKSSKRKSNKHKVPGDNEFKKMKRTGDPKLDLFSVYQPWVVSTYGDLAKTKTITLKKYSRILRVLKGDDSGSSDSSKFRFWVKAKGFHLGKPPGYDAKPADGIICRFSVLNEEEYAGKVTDFESCKSSANDPALYIPSPPAKNSHSQDQVYRKVAIVENFFDIIYTVHVELEGRAGKHAGQKRTYRTITETYAFLPREAVTRFLNGCIECQRRPTSISPVLFLPTPSPSPTNVLQKYYQYQNWESEIDAQQIESDSKVLKVEEFKIKVPRDDEKPQNVSSLKTRREGKPRYNPLDVCNLTAKDPLKNAEVDSWVSGTSSWVPGGKDGSNLMFGQEIDFRMPITSTYLKHLKMLGYSADVISRSENRDSLGSDPADYAEEDFTGDATNVTKEAERLKMMLLAWNYQSQVRNGDVTDSALPSTGTGESMADLWASYHSALGLASGASVKVPGGKATPQREHASPIHVGSAAEGPGTQDETSSSAGGNGKDEDEGTVAGSDDDSDERVDPLTHDPERLKAFNMFVRLFVDENLDRIVPISKQPKEKIQAIIDSCTRQFPEFAERARKRIRTYLKSCRRNKKVRGEATGSTSSGSGATGSGAWDATVRPTPAHLTSAAAEHILAQACENESLNAKRMRLGLEPVSQAGPVLNTESSTTTTSHGTSHLLSLYTTPQLPVATNTTTVRDRSPNRINQDLSTRCSGSPPTFTINNNILKDNANTNNGSKSASPASSPAPLFKASFPQTFSQTNPFSRSASTTTNPALASTALLSTLSAIPPAGVGMNAAAVAAYQTALLSAMASQALPLAAPTDLSTKTAATASSSSTTHKLSPAEAAAVRQLVTGYRESAAFLLRSADELDALLHN